MDVLNESYRKNRDANVVRKDMLRDTLRHTIDSKRQYLRDFVSKAPTPEQTALLQMVQLKGGKLTGDELDAIMPGLANCYMALSCLHTLTAEDGIPVFVMPFDLSDAVRSLDYADKTLTGIIDALDADESDLSIDSVSLLNYDDAQCYLTALLAELDTDAPFLNQERMTRLEALKQAVKTAEQTAQDAMNGGMEEQAARDAVKDYLHKKDYLEKNQESLKTESDIAREADSVIQTGANE